MNRRTILAIVLLVIGAGAAWANWLSLASPGATSGASVPVNSVLPAITGPPQVGGTLVALPGKWTNPNHATTPVDGTYGLIFDEEFNGTSLDLTKWERNWFGGNQSTITTSVNGAGEDAAYDPAQVVVGGGFLAETTVNSPVTVSSTNWSYRTGHIDSNPSSGSTAGGFVGFATNPTAGNPVYMEARMYIPGDGGGTPNVVNWPSFFTGGQSWPTTGETDVAEALHTGAVTGITANYHSAGGAQNSGLLSSNYTGWHIFAALWTTTTVTYYYDGVQVQQYTTNIASAANYFHVHNAMSAANAGANVAPSTVLTEYVHIYLKGGTPITPQSNYGGSSAYFSSYTYQWKRGGVAIGGATNSTYVPVAADVGSTITVDVTASNTAGTSAVATSAATTAVISILPADRLYAWNPGMTSKGGIPVRNTQCGATVSPLGGITAVTNATTPAGNLTTNATTASGNSTLNFASVPGSIVAGILITDANNLIPSGTTVVSTTGTTVVMTNAALGTIANGAVITFSPVASKTLTFASVPAGVAVGLPVSDTTHAADLPSTAYVISKTATTVLLSSPSGPGVANGDTIQFLLDDTAQIQSAVNACMAGQFVKLSAGTFTFSNGQFVLINKGITLRGSGKGSTILARSDGSYFYPGVNGSATGPNPAPLVLAGLGRFGFWAGNPDLNTNSTALTADAVAGASSIAVTSSAAFVPGQIVLLDELSNAGWQTDPAAQAQQVYAASDYRVTWGKHQSLLTTNAPTGAGNATLNFAATGGKNIQAGWGIIDTTTPANIPASTSVNSITGTTVVMSNPSGPGVPTSDIIAFNPPFEDFGPLDFPTNAGTNGDQYSRLGRVTNEIKEIDHIVGNTIFFTSPITISYRTANTAQLTWYSDAGTGLYAAHIQQAGIEDLSTQGGDDGAIVFAWCAYCWAARVENSNWAGQGVHLVACFRCEIRELYSHDASFSSPGGGAYAIAFDQGSSEALVENSISIRANKVMVARAGGAGSVVAYNYMDMGFIYYQSTWMEMGLNASHFVGPHHVLFEGNYGVNMDSDLTHGASIYITYFRNWSRGLRHSFTDPYGNVAVDDASQPGNGPARGGGPTAYGYWFSYVGNVIGASGQMSTWVYNCTTVWSSCSPSIWMSGWGDPQQDNQIQNNGFAGHMIRDGNWDWLNSLQKWENTAATFYIPPSMYLTSKPSFFGSNPWPWSDVTTGTTYTLPAKARFDAGCTPGSC